MLTRIYLWFPINMFWCCVYFFDWSAVQCEVSSGKDVHIVTWGGVVPLQCECRHPEPVCLPSWRVEQHRSGQAAFQSPLCCEHHRGQFEFDGYKFQDETCFHSKKHVYLNSVLQVLDVGHFWGFPADEASLEKQRLLTGEINKLTLNPVTVSLYPNLLCLAPYSESSEQCLYYRAKILHVRGNTVEVSISHVI